MNAQDIKNLRSKVRTFSAEHGTKINVRKGKGSTRGCAEVTSKYGCDPTPEQAVAFYEMLIEAGFESYFAAMDPGMSIERSHLRLARDHGHFMIKLLLS